MCKPAAALLRAQLRSCPDRVAYIATMFMGADLNDGGPTRLAALIFHHSFQQHADTLADDHLRRSGLRYLL